MEQIKIGSWTSHGKVSFMDKISELVPDPLCKAGGEFWRLSELELTEKSQAEIDREIRIKQLHKEKAELMKGLRLIENELMEI